LSRISLLKRKMSDVAQCLEEKDFEEICELTDGYSGSDLTHLCEDAALGPIRSIDNSVWEVC